MGINKPHSQHIKVGKHQNSIQFKAQQRLLKSGELEPKYQYYNNN